MCVRRTDRLLFPKRQWTLAAQTNSSPTRPLFPVCPIPAAETLDGISTRKVPLWVLFPQISSYFPPGIYCENFFYFFFFTSLFSRWVSNFFSVFSNNSDYPPPPNFFLTFVKLSSKPSLFSWDFFFDFVQFSDPDDVDISVRSPKKFGLNPRRREPLLEVGSTTFGEPLHTVCFFATTATSRPYTICCSNSFKLSQTDLVHFLKNL